MKPQELLASAQIPGKAGKLDLYRHDRDFFMRVDGIELMTSRVFGSEELLAELALARLGNANDARVLVGGLGMGFTLAKALSLVGARARVDVVELIPEVVDWNREWLGGLTNNPLSDERVVVTEGDVIRTIKGARSVYDTILLDVDNGPEALTRRANRQLYATVGLKAAASALRKGGVLAVWSSGYYPRFTALLRNARFDVSVEHVRARRTKGPRRTIWLATPASS